MGEHSKLGERNRPQPARRPLAAVVPLLGLIAVIVGCVLAWNGLNETMGWFAYAPLSNQTFAGDGLTYVGAGVRNGLSLAVTGLLVLAFWAGFVTGRRR